MFHFFVFCLKFFFAFRYLEIKVNTIEFFDQEHGNFHFIWHFNLETFVYALKVTDLKWYFKPLNLILRTNGESFQFSSYLCKSHLIFFEQAILLLHNCYLVLEALSGSRLLFLKPVVHGLFRFGPDGCFFSLLGSFHVCNVTRKILSTFL